MNHQLRAPDPNDVRELLREAEGFLHGDDPYGATARARLAVRRADSLSAPGAGEVRQEALLVLDRIEAVEQAAREEVERRRALHVANELRATGMTDEAIEARLTRA